MADWGKNPCGQKKGQSYALEAINLYVKQWTVTYQGLTKNPLKILEIGKVKLTHNQDRVQTSSAQEHLGCYFLPPLDWFAPLEHPRVIVEVEDTHQGLVLAKEHVFQYFCMLLSIYMLQGKPFNDLEIQIERYKVEQTKR